MANQSSITQQCGSILMTCVVILLLLVFISASLSNVLQLGWRKISHSGFQPQQMHTLSSAIKHIGHRPQLWLRQACLHPPLQLTDEALRVTTKWRSLHPCTLLLLDQSIEFIVEDLGALNASSRGYRVSARLTTFMQQLTVTVDQNGQVRRQSWRNMV